MISEDLEGLAGKGIEECNSLHHIQKRGKTCGYDERLEAIGKLSLCQLSYTRIMIVNYGDTSIEIQASKASSLPRPTVTGAITVLFTTESVRQTASD